MNPDDIETPTLRGAQRIHDADARAFLAASLIVLFLLIFGADVYGCIGLRYCKEARDVREVVEPIASACFTALGAAIAFYFADRSR